MEWCGLKFIPTSEDDMAKATCNLPMMMAYDKGASGYESWLEFYQDRTTGKVYITDIMQVTPPEQLNPQQSIHRPKP